MEKRNRRVNIIILVLSFIVLVAGASYAYFALRIVNNPSNKSVSIKTDILKLTFDNTSETLSPNSKIYPGTTVASKTFDIINEGENNEYVVVLENIDIFYTKTGAFETANTPTTLSNDFVYTLTCTSVIFGSCDGVTEEVFPNTDSILVVNNIAKNDVHSYTLSVIFKETGLDQNIDQNKTFTAKVNIYGADNIPSKFTRTETAEDLYMLAAAIDDITVDTVELTDNINISGNSTITIDRNKTIDFNGHSLTAQPDSILVTDGAELILDDDTNTGGISATSNAIVLGSESKLTIEGGSFETTDYLEKGAVVNIPENVDNAKVTINGGVITADYIGINSSGNSEIVINGGTITSTATKLNKDENDEMYHAYAINLTDGHLTVNGGTINGIHGGIAIRGTSSATINSCTITINDSYDGAEDAFYILNVEDNAYADVYGGTFTNNGTRPLINTESTGYINLRGGSWTAKFTRPFRGTVNLGKETIRIYGGTYKKNVNGTLTDYDISGYTV